VDQGPEPHPRLRRQPARAAAGRAARPEERAGHRPRLPHRLQGRLLDRQGKLLHNDVIYPHAGGSSQAAEAGGEARRLVERFKIEAIAIGNGTAGRETEAFVRGLGLPASDPGRHGQRERRLDLLRLEVAREEFPDQDVTVRGAVSIGRRLMDPLAELVKIDPKSIGVGQYQHDVDQTALKRSLDDVVESCVNASASRSTPPASSC
jgi:protein Tex